MDLATCLQQTLVPATRKLAEQQLAAGEASPGFAVMLLSLVQSPATDPSVRFAAALYFKNLAKKHWKQIDGEQDFLAAEDRDAIKATIVPLMISVPSSLQLQLSEAVTIIADNDFPGKWKNLIQDLVARLNLQDLNVNIGVLQTAHSIFKRWRHQFRTDALYLEIKFVIDNFAGPYLEFFKAIDGLIDANSGDKATLEKLFEILFLLTKIFYSFTCLDLPEFFEDHQNEFMDLFSKYLTYSNPLLVSPSDEAGHMEKVKAMICENIDLFARMYEDEFTRLPQFVQLVWTLLTTTSIEQKNDVLVSRMLAFLTSIIKPVRHRELFNNPATLQSICREIILPNMTLRESDEELFEDDPIEYIRRDLEGSDSETRRNAAAELVRGLLEHFAKEVTEIFSQDVNRFLTSYAANPAANWQAKDTALYLITSLSAKSLTAQTGATQTNEHIQIADVFAAHVLPDLQAPVEGAMHHIIKVDAIKYLTVFRGQLTKQQLVSILPLVANHLGSSNFVVHTWAAHAIERIFAMKAGNALLFTPADTAIMSGPILARLFDLIEAGRTPEKLAENDYLMKCAMRTIATVRDQIPDFQNVLVRLTNIIKEISKNPSNPKFNHFVFESLAVLVRFVCVTNPGSVSEFETFLVPQLLNIIQIEVAEFAPYVFQILGQLLSLHAQPGLPPTYQSLITPLVTPTTWESQTNVPALVGLLQAFVTKGSAEIVAGQKLGPILGVCQKLLSSRVNDTHGFELLMTIFEYTSTRDLAPFVQNIFVVLLTRLSQHKTTKFSSGFLNFISFLFALERPDLTVDSVIAIMDSLQPTPLFGGLLQNILLPELRALVVPADRRRCAIGMTKLLTESNTMLNSNYFPIWPEVLLVTMGLLDTLEGSLPGGGVADEEVDVLASLEEETGYQASFVRLATVARPSRDAVFARFPDPAQYLGQAVARLSQAHPGKVEAIVQSQLPQEKATQLRSFMQTAGVTLLR
ncbi:Cse1-domain-containing protein [Entophlyctis helioformis]|nr:Cse1-domain-containing protein [Entophlyctis helioformis]